MASYNILCLLSPILAAWATFRLCHYITRSYWPSLLGGYVFGFSTYMLAELRAHLHLIVVFPLPLIVWLVLRRVHGEISRSTFVLGLAGLVLSEFLVSVEVAATLTFFGALTLAVAFLVFETGTKKRLVAIIPEIVAGYVLLAVLASPYLYCMFAYGFPHGAIWPSKMFSTDLLNFVVPTPVSLVGNLFRFGTLSKDFTANIFESNAYLSWPLIILAIWYGVSAWRTPAGRLLMITFTLFCIFSMGEVLHIGGVETIWLPWKLFVKAPLLAAALPCRFVLFSFLALAVITALFLAMVPPSASAIILALSGVVCLLPNLDRNYWVRPVALPAFFEDDIYPKYLQPNDVIHAMPSADSGDSMLWQAQTNMYFRMADGWLGPTNWSGVWQPSWDGDTCERLEFLTDAHVTAVVVNPWRWIYISLLGPSQPVLKRDEDFERSVANRMQTLGVTGFEVGGVDFYRVPDWVTAPFALPQSEVESRIASSLESMVDNALSYVARCVPEPQPSKEIDVDLSRRINAAAAGMSSGPYSCNSRVAVGRAPAGTIVFYLAASQKHLAGLQAELLNSSIPPETLQIRLVRTGDQDTFLLMISLTRTELLKLVSKLKQSPPCDQ